MIVSFCLNKSVELQQLWIHVILMCHRHMVKTQQHKMHLLISTAQSYTVRSLSFLLSCSCKHIYLVKCTKKKKGKKVLSSKQSSWNRTLFLYSSFQLTVSPENSLDCICSAFILAVFFLFSFLSLSLFFLRGGFVYVMPLGCSSRGYHHYLQQMEISQYKVCRGSSTCAVNDSV